jgi:uncharacterized repeat protein (TIGR03803 family)
VWGGYSNSTDCRYGCGLVYELFPSGATWSEVVLYTFTGGSDGASPVAGLIFDAAGNLYGTTSAGGTHGAGTIFELSPIAGSWTETILYSFTGLGGSYPESLAFDASGNLYGAARQGGSANYGIIFQQTPSGSGWTEHVLHAFTGGKDGSYPNAGIVFDGAGNLYGTASNGGNTTSSMCQTFSGCGVVFELSQTSSGVWRETVPHAFTGGADGGSLQQESRRLTLTYTPVQLETIPRHPMHGLGSGLTVSDSSDRMLLLLQEMAALDTGELNVPDRQRRREEISREIKELAARKEQNEAA